MRNFIYISVFLLVGLSGWAEDEVPFDFDPELAKKIQEAQPQGQIAPMKNPKHYMWLYELIIPEDLQKLKNESIKSFAVHLEDSYSKFPHPDLINSLSLKKPELQSGSITYVGFWPMSYKYDVLVDDLNSRIIRVKVHFKNPNSTDIEHFMSRVKEAEDIWNASRPALDFEYRFVFEVVRSKKDAHYSLNIKDKTRGPYSVNWSRRWSAISIAHELGHMMGLGDEYETLTGKMHCLRSSLMCGGSKTRLMPHHYYFVLRRLIKN